MQFEGAAIIDNRMPGIVAAAIAYDHTSLAGQPVYNMAFALIAPLCADQSDDWHRRILSVSTPLCATAARAAL
jgi:hypothetical protein